MRLDWQVAEVCEVVSETPRVKSLLLHVPSWGGHRPGQHMDIRLTAEDGYQAQRSYSIASAPEDHLLSITVELVGNGEVSSYLVQDIQVGDRFELRGPIGGYFVWTAAMGGPLCLIAGGSGIAPLMAMLRHRQRLNAHASTLLIYSSRTSEDIIFRNELEAMALRDSDLRIIHALTRQQPRNWVGHRGRIDKTLLAGAGFSPTQSPQIFVCGSAPFVEDVSRFLVELGHQPKTIKTERFGPSGSPPS